MAFNVNRYDVLFFCMCVCVWCADRRLLSGIAAPLHTPRTPQREHETESGAEQDNHRSRFSQNPLVDRDPSFAQTPDGRFCECLIYRLAPTHY